LQGTPHTVDAVGTAAAAFERVRAGRPDLVLLDLRLPDGDGLDLARRMRAWEAQQRAAPTAIAVLSADDSAASRRRARAADVTAFLAKPLARAALLDFLAGRDPEMEALVGKYRRARHADLETMRAALRDRDFDVIRQLGHSMKGSGGAYGFAEITRL